MKFGKNLSLGLLFAVLAGFSAYADERVKQRQSEKIEELEHRISELEYPGD